MIGDCIWRDGQGEHLPDSRLRVQDLEEDSQIESYQGLITLNLMKL